MNKYQFFLKIVFLDFLALKQFSHSKGIENFCKNDMIMLLTKSVGILHNASQNERGQKYGTNEKEIRLNQIDGGDEGY